MKTIVKNLWILLLVMFTAVACDQSNIEDVKEQAATLKSGGLGDWVIMDNNWAWTRGDLMHEVCEEGDVWPFFESANVTITNDEECIYVKVTANEGWLIHRLAFNAWPVGSPDINYNYDTHPYQKWFVGDEMTNVVEFRVCNEWETTECLVFNIKVFTQKDDGSFEYWWTTFDNIRDENKGNVYLDYCWKDCEECLPFRTQTPGGWGAPANGNNPGAYRDANFAGAFPTGLVVGGDYTLTLSSAAAVEAFLPSGGTPMSLTMDYVDPAGMLENTFASHIVALTLSLGFDAYDSGFSESDTWLGDLELMDGLGFDGMTIYEVLTEANIVLGGGSSSYSLNDLHEVISAINEYYVDGEWTGDGTLLKDCYDYYPDEN